MRHRRERPQAISFRGGELRWLASGVLMLVVLLMIMVRLREPGSLNWLGDLNQNAGGARGWDAGTPPAAALPEASGETDEDPDQAETAREEFQAITDGTLTVGPEEQIPYNRLVFWVQNQSFARLWARAKKNLAYTYLYDQADKHRGTLAALDVEIRMVHRAGKNEHGVPLNEVWATTKQSGDRLYDLIVVDLPSRIPIDRPIREKARFAGYFLKLQGYHPGLSKPGVAPEKAPLLVGRLEWTPSAAATEADNWQEWFWGGAALAIVAVILAVRFVLGRLRPRAAAPRGILNAPSDAVIPVDVWLEHSGFASPDDEKSNGGDGGHPSSPNDP
jgi:hypothetical protein